MNRAEMGRDHLSSWLDARAGNYCTAAPHLVALLEQEAGEARTRAMAPALTAFGATVATVIEPLVVTLESHRDLPALVAYDGIGRRADAIEFHPSYDEVGRAVWGSGLLAVNRGGHRAFEQAALFYLLSHVGEGGHACPAVCTAGLARALERRASTALADAYLDGLFATDYASCVRGSQFLTEIQGGSDVGANAAVATPDLEVHGAWRLSGEKWFCSVADADLFAVTARPDGAPSGTKGLGCFLVPRSLDGSSTHNGFTIRRLKDKLGTRCMASAEIEFDGALAWPIGPIDEGFHVAVEELLDTSRWLNAIGSTGIMRRAYLEASSYARHRTAFGRPIGALAAVRAQLASMKADEHAALASSLMLTGLIERVDAGTASPEERAAHRILVSANKLVTSLDGTDVVHRAIEVLGGNGTIEDFSALPRLYRDSIVYESWEGTHHVLSAQVLRDLGRGDTLDAVIAWLDGVRARTGVDLAQADVDGIVSRLRAATADPDHHAAAFRALLVSLVRVVQACALGMAQSGALEATATYFAAARLGPGAPRPGASDGLVDAVVGPDLDR